MKKNVVLLTVVVLSLTMFAFISPQEGSARLAPGGNFICNNVPFSVEDEHALSVLQRDRGDGGYFVRCQTSKNTRGFTVGTIAGSRCAKIVVSFRIGDIQEENEIRDQVNQIMSKYMGL